jgi:hypothetical protein
MLQLMIMPDVLSKTRRENDRHELQSIHSSDIRTYKFFINYSELFKPCHCANCRVFSSFLHLIAKKSAFVIWKLIEIEILLSNKTR